MAKKLMVICFWAMLVVPTLIYPLVKGILPESNTENRVLAEWPSGIPSPSKIEEYINDHAAFRGQYLSLYAWSNLKLFDSIDSRDVINGKGNWLFYTGNESLQAYRGMELFPEEYMEKVLDYMLQVRDRYTEEDKNFVFMIAPDKELVYDQYMPDYYFKVSDSSKAKQLVEYIRANSDIQVLYPLDLLKEESKNQLVYYMTDTHWNDAGGFLASQEIIGALGGQKAGMDQVSVEFKPMKPGDLGNMFHMPVSLCEDYDATVKGYYDDAQAEYPVNDIAVAGVVKSVNDKAVEQRKLTMVRDSFGQATIVPLSRYYKEAFFVNWEKIPNNLEELQDSDLFVYEIVERNLGRILDDLDALLK